MTTYRQMIGRYGALRSWANTVDRPARTRAARRNSPSSNEYWLARLPEQFANATDQQRLDAAIAARRAYYLELSLKSAIARRGGDGDAPDAA